MFNWWIKNYKLQIKNELSDLEPLLKDRIAELYPHINILEFDINIKYKSYSAMNDCLIIEYKCNYEYGPKSYIILNIINNEIRNIEQKYKDDIWIDINTNSIHRIYSNDLILNTGRKYLKCIDIKCIPYNIGTIYDLQITICGRTQSLYSLVIQELQALDNITPSYNNGEEK